MLPLAESALLIAVLIAVVVTQPLVLRLFESAIASEIEVSRTQQVQDFAARSYASPHVHALQTRLTDAQTALWEVLRGEGPSGVPGNGPRAADLRAEVDRASAGVEHRPEPDCGVNSRVEPAADWHTGTNAGAQPNFNKPIPVSVLSCG